MSSTTASTTASCNTFCRGPTIETVACLICASRDSSHVWAWIAKDAFAVNLGMPGRRSRWVMCRSCGLVFQNPRPTLDETARLYAGEVYRKELSDAVVDERMEYFLRRPLNALAWLYDQPEFAERFGHGRGGKALDIGSGWGGALLRLKERGWEPYGVEPDPRCAEYANGRFGVPTRAEFLTEATWPDVAFSFVFSQHAFEHMLDPLAVARVARRLLDREDGLLFVCVPTYRRTGTYAWSYFNTAHTYMFTHRTLGNLLARAGFRVLRHRYFTKWDREGEVWVLAGIDRSRGATGVPLPYHDVRWRRQLELALVPLTAVAGTLWRAVFATWLLLTRPTEFFATSSRLKLLFTDRELLRRKAARKLRNAATRFRLQFTRAKRLERPS